MAKYITVLIFLFISTVTFSNGGKKHKKDSTKQDSTAMVADTNHVENHDHHQHGSPSEKPVAADLKDFPSIHPLIVHFAIVLIIVAAFLQAINLIFVKKEFAWVVTGLVVIGFNAALLASTKFHPHTHDLSSHAKEVLHMHDQYADWTVSLAGVAGSLQILNLFFFKDRRWALGIVAIVMVGASYCIIHAGHYGAQLVHIEGVGPRGKFLETQHEH